MNDISFVASVWIGLIVWTVLILALFESFRDFLYERKRQSCNTCRYRDFHDDNDDSQKTAERSGTE